MQERIRDVLAAHGRMAVDPRDVDGNADLYELGLTSHASVNVMLALEDEFDIEFPDEVLAGEQMACLRETYEGIENLEEAVSFLFTGNFQRARNSFRCSRNSGRNRARSTAG